MPLIIEGQISNNPVLSIEDFLHQSVDKVKSDELRCQEVAEVGPERLVYVNQREYAIVSVNDENIDVIGTEDATTCHIMVLRHSGSGVTCLAHCDGCDTERGLASMVTDVLLLSHGAPEGRLELTLVGGFLDRRKESQKLSKEMIGCLQKMTQEVHLVCACITDFNDVLKNNLHFPVIYGLAVEVKTGRVFPATFPQKGPELDVRSACHFGGFRDLWRVYSSETGELVIGPYSWQPFDEVALWINLPDPIIRKHLSTSPEQEPPGFEAQVRRALRVLEQHPQPETTLFPGGKPHKYKPQADGTWARVTL